jgi:hypothetical protein
MKIGMSDTSTAALADTLSEIDGEDNMYAWVEAKCQDEKQISSLDGDVTTQQQKQREKLESLLPQLHLLSQEFHTKLQNCLETLPTLNFANHLNLLQLKANHLGKHLSVNLSRNVAATTQVVQPSPSSQEGTYVVGMHNHPHHDDSGDAPVISQNNNAILAQLHDAKKHMHECINALHESAAWKQHCRCVSQAMLDIKIATASYSSSNSNSSMNFAASMNWTSLATHLVAMQKSFSALLTMPGKDERLATIQRCDVRHCPCMICMEPVMHAYMHACLCI